MTLAFASFIVLLTIFGILFSEGSKKIVTLTLNGQQKVVKTHADSIQELLDELYVSNHPKDYLYPKGNTKVKDHLKIIWRQANLVYIVKDNEKKTIWTTAGTVAEFLKEQKIILNEHDKLSTKTASGNKE